MAKAKPTPKVVRSGDYEEAAMAFLRVMALEVDDALKEAKVTDVKTRRKVVDNFCFGMGNFLDQYWFEAADGKRYFPMVGFSTEHQDYDPKTIGLPDMFSYHEIAGDDFDALTRKGKGPYQLKIGLVGDDEPIDLEAEDDDDE